jgi:hypothetical protein
MPSYRYSVRLFTTLPATRIRTLIISALDNDFDFLGWNPRYDEFANEYFEISIDDKESVCFYFNKNKTDKYFINSVIVPVMKNLGFKKLDYDIDDYKTGKADTIYNDYDDESCQDNDCQEEEDSASLEKESYRYSTDIPLFDMFAYKRIALAINQPTAFPRTHPDCYDSPTGNNYGEYICENYKISLDGDMAFIYFKSLDFDFIASVMNPILDALMLIKGDFEINDELIKDSYSIKHELLYDINYTHSIVFPLPSINSYKHLNKALCLNLTSNNSFQIINVCEEEEDAIGWNLCGQFGYYNYTPDLSTDVSHTVFTIKRALNIPASSIHIVNHTSNTNKSYFDSDKSDDNSSVYSNEYENPALYINPSEAAAIAKRKADNGNLFINVYDHDSNNTINIGSVPEYKDNVDRLIKIGYNNTQSIFITICKYYLTVFNSTPTDNKAKQVNICKTLFTHINNNINDLIKDFNPANLNGIKKLLQTFTSKAQELTNDINNSDKIPLANKNNTLPVLYKSIEILSAITI